MWLFYKRMVHYNNVDFFLSLKGIVLTLCVCLECMMIEIMLGGKDIQRFL